MIGDLGQRLSAVGRSLEQAAALRADHGDQHIDERHQQGTEQPGLYGAFGDFSWFLDPQ